MSDSVIPSERYSRSGLPLALGDLNRALVTCRSVQPSVSSTVVVVGPDGEELGRVAAMLGTETEDARRRDFTINGLFYDIERDEVIDYVGGQEDLKLGLIRAIGDPKIRIVETEWDMTRRNTVLVEKASNFFRSKDPQGLTAWYRDHLGVGGGCGADEQGQTNEWLWHTQGGPMVFEPCAANSDYFAADKAFMINLRVEDLDGLLGRLRSAGIEVETRAEWDDPATGRFARIHDPEGNAIELWEPPAA